MQSGACVARPVGLADAALIVTTVNAHDDLVAALRRLLRQCETGFTGWPASLGEVEARDMALAALAKAGAQP